MKRLFVFVAIIAAVSACNNSGNKDNDTKNVPVTTVDSLEKDIDDGHMAVMSKMGRLSTLKNKVQADIDSLAKLPAKAQEAAAPYRAKLESVGNDLKAAEASMEKWMTEYNMDSALNNVAVRIKYLSEEKLKVSAMKDAVLGSLQKADSLLKAKF